MRTTAINQVLRDSIIGSNLDLNLVTNTPVPASPPNHQQNPQSSLDFELELNDIEERYETICSSSFNFDTLSFVELQPTTTEPRAEAILDALVPTAVSTRRFVHRVNELKHLIYDLRALHEDYGLSTLGGASASDIARYGTILATLNLELENYLSTAQLSRDKLRRMEQLHTEQGLKSYQFCKPYFHNDTYDAFRAVVGTPAVTPYSTGRVIPPIAMAAIITIAIIHFLMGVARDNCNTVLKLIRSILRFALQAQELRARSYASTSIDTIPVNLDTALSYLGLSPQLDILVTCPTCSDLYAPATVLPDKCGGVDISGQRCNTPLFKVCSRGNRAWRKPISRYSHQRLEVWLSKFLIRPGVEDLLEQARPIPQTDGVTDFWGAPFLANFPENEESSFFDAPKDELRLVFMIYHDFFNPYTNKIAGKQRSIGMVMMVCLNLPPAIRYNRENVYLASVIPGPNEPEGEKINKFIQPIADNLKEHFDPGVWIARTAKYPNGRKVRSAAPISSMDIPASRAWGGLGDVFTPGAFEIRTMDQHHLHVQRWLSAPDEHTRNKVWSDHGARYSEWLKFPWWNVFTGTTIAPMHWMKNIIEKQLRDNMGWSWTVPAGIPEPPPLKPLSVLETEWGRLAIKYAPVDDFKLTEPILRYLCRKYKIYNVGLSSARMIHDLNEERLKQGIVDAKGNVVNPAPSLGHSGKASVVSVAKAEYYLSKGKDTTLLSSSNHEDLLLLCEKFSLPYAEKDTKDILAHRLLEYHKKIRVDIDEETNQPASRNPVAWLGSDVLREVKADMDDTCLPSWLKAPPKNFATVSHGKIGAEEYKSLMLVSFTVTLVRLWGHSAVGPFREALDNFLHLSLAIRILSYQTTTKPDDQAFDHHYRTYLAGVKLIYPHCSITTVQHLGLHIPYFLRNLGPAARFNENPAEMFIGMLQDIPTNWKIGDLGVTLHNEFNMAADLQGLLQDPSVIESLGIVGDVLTEYIRGRYPGRPNELLSGWQTVHQGQSFRLDDAAYATYCDWASSRNLVPITRHQVICSRVQNGHLVYQPFSHSAGNSHILFRSSASDSPIHGQIESILEEPRSAVPTGSTPRITLLVRRFKPLNSADHFLDPYGQHPVIGIRGYQIAQLCYREFLPTAFIIEPRDIVCHIATCDYHDADLKFLTPCVVVISLDLKHALPA